MLEHFLKVFYYTMFVWCRLFPFFKMNVSVSFVSVFGCDNSLDFLGTNSPYLFPINLMIWTVQINQHRVFPFVFVFYSPEICDSFIYFQLFLIDLWGLLNGRVVRKSRKRFIFIKEGSLDKNIKLMNSNNFIPFKPISIFL